ncbi:uncharacterized protein A1O9_11606 [Exophiala aquamarina CBS 119918]|uniref:EthD domain-containing protein n=1 Tax=Exophiala aquamarina CBS 119918 TaxID=1182545 RepID=A0A072P9Z4_9EURO|nr:uncharacterized protein A1O9_11606 [Exophiala aquamarina CBS 119918]KEF52365.1 hypothetical protein A1O9_11606 [Exophiala aquamarina CBS 119918]
MPYITMVAYPDTPTATFDEEYYVHKHLPMVFQQWEMYGLLDWKVIKFDKNPGDSRPYIAASYMTWNSAESFKTATATDSMVLMIEDLKNFSNIEPVFLNGSIIGSR